MSLKQTRKVLDPAYEQRGHLFRKDSTIMHASVIQIIDDIQWSSL